MKACSIFGLLLVAVVFGVSKLNLTQMLQKVIISLLREIDLLNYNILVLFSPLTVWLFCYFKMADAGFSGTWIDLRPPTDCINTPSLTPTVDNWMVCAHQCEQNSCAAFTYNTNTKACQLSDIASYVACSDNVNFITHEKIVVPPAGGV